MLHSDRELMPLPQPTLAKASFVNKQKKNDMRTQNWLTDKSSQTNAMPTRTWFRSAKIYIGSFFFCFFNMSISVHTHALHTTMLKPHFIPMKRHCGTRALNIYICAAWLEKKQLKICTIKVMAMTCTSFKTKAKKNIREPSACRTLQLN